MNGLTAFPAAAAALKYDLPGDAFMVARKTKEVLLAPAE